MRNVTVSLDEATIKILKKVSKNKTGKENVSAAIRFLARKEISKK